jgi:replication initiation and membrane attachment protein DnaB
MTKKEKLLEFFETVSWEVVVIGITGTEPNSAEITLINTIKEKYKLPDPVINVLVEFVMFQTDKKLPKAYTETIASHWARKNIKTAAEAMDVARIEHKKREILKKVDSYVTADRNKLNAKVLELIAMYNEGKVEYAVGGLQTLSEVFGVDLLNKYGIKVRE